eukprot:m.195851 g.195851  ORF g.195851 m.195851 type:complete len:306 (-) comp19642_c0_seq1:1873-2790(-)
MHAHVYASFLYKDTQTMVAGEGLRPRPEGPVAWLRRAICGTSTRRTILGHAPLPVGITHVKIVTLFRRDPSMAGADQECSAACLLQHLRNVGAPIGSHFPNVESCGGNKHVRDDVVVRFVAPHTHPRELRHIQEIDVPMTLLHHQVDAITVGVEKILLVLIPASAIKAVKIETAHANVQEPFDAPGRALKLWPYSRSHARLPRHDEVKVLTFALVDKRRVSLSIARQVGTLVGWGHNLVARPFEIAQACAKHGHAVGNVAKHTLEIAACVRVWVKHITVGIEFARPIGEAQMCRLNACSPENGVV